MVVLNAALVTQHWTLPIHILLRTQVFNLWLVSSKEFFFLECVSGTARTPKGEHILVRTLNFFYGYAARYYKHS